MREATGVEGSELGIRGAGEEKTEFLELVLRTDRQTGDGVLRRSQVCSPGLHTLRSQEEGTRTPKAFLL